MCNTRECRTGTPTAAEGREAAARVGERAAAAAAAAAVRLAAAAVAAVRAVVGAAARAAVGAAAGEREVDATGAEDKVGGWEVKTEASTLLLSIP